MNIDFLENRLGEYAILLRLHQPIGIYLLLWPTLWALWLSSNGQPPRKDVLIFTLGVVLMRSAGCIINDIADRNFDLHVVRTRDRPVAAGRVSLREAIRLATLLCLLAFFLVLLTQDLLTIKLSFVGLALAFTYPFMKRFHHLPQFYLGVAFGWGIPMAYAAVTGTIPLTAWLLFTANIIWSAVYDTQYAMVDRDEDLKIGLKSTAILFGKYDKCLICYLQVLLLCLLVTIGLLASRGLVYYLSLFIAGVLALYQQYLIRNRDPESCFKAFLNNNNFGLVIFYGLLLDYLPRSYS